jgi:hypothetical protein
MGTLLPAVLFPSCTATSDGLFYCVQPQDAYCVDELMPPSPCRGSTNTAAVLPFTMAARALSRSSYFASLAPPMSGKNGVLYCSCTCGGRMTGRTTCKQCQLRPAPVGKSAAGSSCEDCCVSSPAQLSTRLHLVCEHQGAKGASVEAGSEGHQLAGRLCSLVIWIHARCAAHRAKTRLMVLARGRH